MQIEEEDGSGRDEGSRGEEIATPGRLFAERRLELAADGMPMQARHRAQLYRLVTVVHLWRRTLNLQRQYGEGDTSAHKLLAVRTSAVSWALDMLGYPPSRYHDVFALCKPKREGRS